MKRFVLMCACLWVLTACGSLSVTPTPEQAGNGEQQIQTVEGPNFKLNPLKVGDTEVSGEAPANISIQIVDVTLMGEVLATFTTDSSGAFKGALTQPLAPQHMIGILIPNESGLDPSVYASLKAKGGSGLQVYPQVGTVFDKQVVVP